MARRRGYHRRPPLLRVTRYQTVGAAALSADAVAKIVKRVARAAGIPAERLSGIPCGPGSPPPPTLTTGHTNTNQHTHSTWTHNRVPLARPPSPIRHGGGKRQSVNEHDHEDDENAHTAVNQARLGLTQAGISIVVPHFVFGAQGNFGRYAVLVSIRRGCDAGAG